MEINKKVKQCDITGCENDNTQGAFEKCPNCGKDICCPHSALLRIEFWYKSTKRGEKEYYGCYECAEKLFKDFVMKLPEKEYEKIREE